MRTDAESLVRVFTPPMWRWAEQRQAGGVLDRADNRGTGRLRPFNRPQLSLRKRAVSAEGPNPHGVKSAPKTDDGVRAEPGNLTAASAAFDAKDDRDGR